MISHDVHDANYAIPYSHLGDISLLRKSGVAHKIIWPKPKGLHYHATYSWTIQAIVVFVTLKMTAFVSYKRNNSSNSFAKVIVVTKSVAIIGVVSP